MGYSLLLRRVYCGAGGGGGDGGDGGDGGAEALASAARSASLRSELLLRVT
jgi:hypothetical protein